MKVVLTRLKLLYDSVQSCINSAQCALKQISEGEANYRELELTGVKFKSATQRFVAEIHIYCQLVTEPDTDKITEYTSIQIQAEDLVSEIDICIKSNDRKRSVATTNGENLNISSKLPKMELSKFDGDVLKWYQFWDQFSSNVDGRNINEVDKLLYLQSVLEGDAKQAIEGLDTTNTNYSIAVQTLKERFGKPAAIIDAHYVALNRIKPVATNHVKDCRHVLNEIERHLRVLSSLGEDVNHNHLRVMIMEKFPEDLIYEVRMKMTDCGGTFLCDVIVYNYLRVYRMWFSFPRNYDVGEIRLCLFLLPPQDEEEKIDGMRKYLELIISARETANRVTKNTIDGKTTESTISEEKDKTENITTGALHIRSEENTGNMQRGNNNYRKDKYKNDNRRFSKTQSKKRQNEASENSDGPPKKKFARKCIFCRQDHYNDECTKYKNLQDRKARLRNRCFICFQERHRASTCRNDHKCYYCSEYGAHNRAICPKKFAQPPAANEVN